MKIRVAITEDFPIIQSLFQELFLLFPNRQEERWPHTKEGQEYLSKKIATDHIFVAELNRNIVGYLIWSTRQGMSFQQFKNYAELQSMCVSEKHRNNGIGTKLCKAFLDVCEREGLDTIMVESSILPETVGFYEKLGFVEERKIMFLSRSSPNKAKSIGRQKTSLVPHSAFYRR